MYSFHVLDDLYGSDHFSVQITTDIERKIYPIPKRWLFEKADWKIFTADTILPQTTRVIEVDADSITNNILDSTSRCITRTSGELNKRPVPWWNDEISEAIK